MKRIDFWFSIGSTYTYLTVMRLREVEEAQNVRFNWRPFSVRALMLEMNNVPFKGKPVKEKYMWRDLQRRAARYRIPATFPVSYPLENFDRANRIAIVGEQEGWCADYVRAAYKLWMQESLPAGDEENVVQSLEIAGQDPERVVVLAKSDETKEAYEDATAEARSLGIFGAPSFVVDGRELFWGDDRLEDAIEFVRGERS
jgi:2-hydroxychromene-2-carboxylate isomerase